MEYTPVHNRFWSDGWVRKLNALDRYLFLYLLTNGRAKHTGIYELPIDMMASESGIDERDLQQSMLNRLEPKVYYKEGWVIITNYQKHSINTSPDYRKGVGRSFFEIPSKIREIATSYGYVSTHPPPTLPPPSRDNRIEENRIDTSAQEPRIVSEDSKEEKAKSKPKYPHSKEVFGWFPKPERSWSLNTTELSHAELLFERGEAEVKKRLKYIVNHSDEDFLPKITKPSELERKWNDLSIYAKRNR